MPPVRSSCVTLLDFVFVAGPDDVGPLFSEVFLASPPGGPGVALGRARHDGGYRSRDVSEVVSGG